MQSSTQVHREALQRQTQQDWANREYIELVIQIVEAKQSFDTICKLIEVKKMNRKK